MTSTYTVPEPLQALRYKHLLSLKLEIAAVHKLGVPGAGTIIGVVAGGEFEGPKLKGRVLAGGSDWQHVLPDGSLRLDCRIVFARRALLLHGSRGSRLFGCGRELRSMRLRPYRRASIDKYPGPSITRLKPIEA